MKLVISRRSLLVAAPAFAWAGSALGQGDGVLDRDWTGPLVVQGGQRVELTFKLRQVLGEARGTLDVPAQGLEGMGLSQVLVDGARVRLVQPALGMGVDLTLAADGNRLEGMLSQGGVTLPLTLEARAAARRPQTPRSAPAYRQEAVAYVNPASGGTLSGRLTMPLGAGPHPAVILVTGSGSQDHDETIFDHRPFAVIADRLTREGIAVLRVDDRGVGGSAAGPPDPTMADLVTDVQAGVAFLRGRAGIDAGQIGLIGHSEGGNIGAEVAAQDGRVAFLVMLAGLGLRGDKALLLQTAAAARLNGGNLAQVEEGGRFNRAVFSAAVEAPDQTSARTAILEAALAVGASTDAANRASQNMSRDGIRYLLRYDPTPTLAKLTVPVLALTGSKDYQVVAAENLSAMRTAMAGNARAEIAEVEGVNHLFQTAPTGKGSEYVEIEETFAPVVLDRVAAWVKARAGV